MEDFKLSDFINYYSYQLQMVEHMHMTAMSNLNLICKGCLKQEVCWKGFRFIDLCLYENNRCINYLKE